MFMRTTPKQRVIWVKREGGQTVADSVLRGRAGVDDAAVEVETKAVARWGDATIPAGARDESGRTLPPLSLGYAVLPPEGRVFLVEDK